MQLICTGRQAPRPDSAQAQDMPTGCRLHHTGARYLIVLVLYCFFITALASNVPVEVLRPSETVLTSSACGAWLPDLMKVKSWKSQSLRCPTDITVVTQLSLDRLDMLDRLCSTWQGWVSAAVYVQLDHNSYASLHYAVAKLDSFHAQLEQSNTCKLNMMLYTPQAGSTPDRPLMHPLNALRNKAMAAAQTEVLLLLDVDFMISASLNEPQNSAWVHEMVTAGVLVVLPAFEPVHSNVGMQETVIRTCRGGKAAVLEGIGSSTLQPFHVDRFEAGHSATNIPHWASSHELYNVQYNMGYEPYVLVSKSLVPWYDERFTGYLEDKVVHIQTMNSMGFRFAVHPEAFVVHYPHANSKDQQLVKSTNLMHEIQTMGDGARFEMDQGTYLPPTRFAPCHQPYRMPASTGIVPWDNCIPGDPEIQGTIATSRRHVAATNLQTHHNRLASRNE